MSFRCQYITPNGHDMYIEYLDHLRSLGKRYFTFEQAIQDLKVSTNSAKSGLYRMRNKGKLITPAKGLYVIVPPEHQLQGSIPAEELVPILMRYLEAEYYVSFLSAAAFHGATHQKPGRFQIVSNKRIKHPLEFGQIKLEVIYKKSLSNLPLQDFTVATGYLKVASPELVVLDLLNYPARAGGLNHIATVLTELVEAINAEKLIKLAEKNGKKAWLQRLGFILEKIDPMDEDNVLLLIEKLQEYLNGKISVLVPLASELPKTGFSRIKKWGIIENTDIESDL